MNKYGLLGHHLSHSYSPIIHNYLYNKNKIDASYTLIEIEECELKRCIDDLKQGIYSGYNVTIPYKEKVMNYCDLLTEAAHDIGAVNTIYMKDGKVVGDNTDYLGFITELEFYGVHVNGKDIYVLGNGGASKAICYAIKLLGGNPVVVSRNNEGISYQDLEKINHYPLLINTTPVGMFPNVDASIIDEEFVKRADLCIDLIFNPQTTKFLSYSNVGYNGLLMLVFQAIHAVELWQQSKITYELEELIKLF